MNHIRRLMINTIGGGAGWTGGLYYARNIAFVLLQNEYIKQNWQIYICCTKKNRKVFEDLQNQVKLITCPVNGTLPEYAFKEMVCLTRRISYEYWGFRPTLSPWTKTISWIADFQHNHYAQFFTEDEIRERTMPFQRAADSPNPMVLSSEDAMNDLRSFYSKEKQNVYVVPFVSYIEPMIRQVSGRETETLERLKLTGKKYACVMNQFWQHKNHKVVFDAMEELYTRNPEINLDLVMTGEMSDYRNPAYIETLKAYMGNPVIKEHLHLLGFISREDQIAVMRQAEFVIQPSLFEGWGTVVEDAKVLDKTILLSDIPVHREQKNDKCILFDPHDAKELAQAMEAESGKTHTDDSEAGIRDMYHRAAEYSKGFEQLLRDAEKGSKK